MKVTATRTITVKSSDGKDVTLERGESADVDGRTYGSDHMFVKAGYLVVDREPVAGHADTGKGKRGRPAKQDSDKQEDQSESEE